MKRQMEILREKSILAKNKLKEKLEKKNKEKEEKQKKEEKGEKEEVEEDLDSMFNWRSKG